MISNPFNLLLRKELLNGKENTSNFAISMYSTEFCSDIQMRFRFILREFSKKIIRIIFFSVFCALGMSLDCSQSAKCNEPCMLHLQIQNNPKKRQILIDKWASHFARDCFQSTFIHKKFVIVCNAINIAFCPCFHFFRMNVGTLFRATTLNMMRQSTVRFPVSTLPMKPLHAPFRKTILHPLRDAFVMIWKIRRRSNVAASGCILSNVLVILKLLQLNIKEFWCSYETEKKKTKNESKCDQNGAFAW